MVTIHRSDGDAIELDHDNCKQLWLGWLIELILYKKKTKKIFSLMFFFIYKKLTFTQMFNFGDRQKRRKSIGKNKIFKSLLIFIKFQTVA